MMKKIWTNGCFDVIHRGHIELFKYAKSLGDYLVVGIDSDERIKYLKGNSRPINNQQDRKYLLEAITYVDEVVVFHSNSCLRSKIESTSPSAMVIGSEYKNKIVIGSEICTNIIFFDRIEKYSSTKIINKLE